MIGVYRRSSAAALVLLTCACADLRWHKDGADAAALGRDLDECRQLARVQASREAWPPGASVPRIVGTDAQGHAIMGTPGPGESDRFLAEYDLERQCMSGKGYELVPAKNP